MKAIDTNILIRLIVDDDPDQSRCAEKIVSEGVFVPLTVLLETAWVLSSRYRMGRDPTAATLSRLLDVPGIIVTDEVGVRQAIALYRAGADIADVIHLVAARGSEAFVTFDRDLAKRRDALIPIELA
ncbi:type II toxin-antitoxin system VapC family toxin [Sphingomonas sp. AP4-R1]|uniref:type II toxin-antitoxin system VapC family toxin n=1 Tax=Sphingomonas sp. AP4-R1 TaxID=2735134 RepID=UPI0014936EB8|nr:type II toxin-antitoxin system VapC family toxin [Sphingomonas sp. AP4-R1]QJU59395.1 type II toxin-antitoxin system VapC family toxin [Sphingomonas sp. AP4-R1]